MQSRISCIGISGVQQKILQMHARSWNEDFVALRVGGFYRYRRSGETHAWSSDEIHTLQAEVSSETYQTYKKYSEAVRSEERRLGKGSVGTCTSWAWASP